MSSSDKARLQKLNERIHALQKPRLQKLNERIHALQKQAREKSHTLDTLRLELSQNFNTEFADGTFNTQHVKDLEIARKTNHTAELQLESESLVFAKREVALMKREHAIRSRQRTLDENREEIVKVTQLLEHSGRVGYCYLENPRQCRRWQQQAARVELAAKPSGKTTEQRQTTTSGRRRHRTLERLHHLPVDAHPMMTQPEDSKFSDMSIAELKNLWKHMTIDHGVDIPFDYVSLLLRLKKYGWNVDS